MKRPMRAGVKRMKKLILIFALLASAPAHSVTMAELEAKDQDVKIHYLMGIADGLYYLNHQHLNNHGVELFCGMEESPNAWAYRYKGITDVLQATETLHDKHLQELVIITMQLEYACETE